MSWFTRFIPGVSATTQRSDGDRSPNISNVVGPVTIDYAAHADPPLQMVLFSQTRSTRMHFRARVVPLLGRQRELQQLEAFLETPDPFKWWLITGPGGSGKSRLALELCLNVQKTWRVGFLPETSTYEAWADWTVREPWLIVADYATMRAERLQKMITSLAARAQTFEYPVRILLVERSTKNEWWQEFLGTGSTRLLLESCGYTEPLELSALSGEELWQYIIEWFRNAGMAQLPSKEETLEALTRLDPLHRPLFAALAADAMAAGRNIQIWDQTTLLRDVLERERARWKTIGVTDRDKNLLCFATILGGAPVEALSAKPIREWQQLPTTESGDPHRFNATRYEAMTGVPATEFLAPLKPDAVGEFYVLEHLRPVDAADETRASLMIVLAWLAEPLRVFEFATRVFDDYPDHPSTGSLKFTLSNSGIKMMLDMVGNDTEFQQRLLFGLAPAKANLVRTLSRRGDVKQAGEQLFELMQLSDLFPATAVLEPIAMSATSWVAGGLISQQGAAEARALFNYCGKRWKARSDGERNFQLMVQACLMEATLGVQDNKVVEAVQLCSEIVRLTLDLPGPQSACGTLAEGMGALVSDLTEKGALAEAKCVIESISTLRIPSGNDNKVIANFGIAGLAFVLSFTKGIKDEPTEADMEILAAVVRSIAPVVESPDFGKDVLEAQVIDSAKGVLRKVLEIIPTAMGTGH